MNIQSEEGQHNVVLKSPVSTAEGASLISSSPSFGNVSGAVIKFTKVLDFTTFSAEYSMDGGNLVVHFFMPEDHHVTESYWKDFFADVLNAVAQEHFQATAPRLLAKYTEELHSWWFKAGGYGHLLDVSSYVTVFFEKMDMALDAKFRQSSKAKTPAE